MIFKSAIRSAFIGWHCFVKIIIIIMFYLLILIKLIKVGSHGFIFYLMKCMTFECHCLLWYSSVLGSDQSEPLTRFLHPFGMTLSSFEHRLTFTWSKGSFICAQSQTWNSPFEKHSLVLGFFLFLEKKYLKIEIRCQVTLWLLGYCCSSAP